ncbi:unnamed protein product [Prorocentrum cordatum]|uniref:Uncharacterized protein n=1 Tax=Prorocentrum cordatum TaxID=2364126 RepID=A0ABN9WIY2_9DINO|nr:unnamed protein product [Polarella glacialis]
MLKNTLSFFLPLSGLERSPRFAWPSLSSLSPCAGLWRLVAEVVLAPSSPPPCGREQRDFSSDVRQRRSPPSFLLLPHPPPPSSSSSSSIPSDGAAASAGRCPAATRPLRVAAEKREQPEPAAAAPEPVAAESAPSPQAPTFAARAAEAAAMLPWSRGQRSAPAEAQRRPEHPAVELPGKVQAIACGFRNSCVVCELPAGER